MMKFGATAKFDNDRKGQRRGRLSGIMGFQIGVNFYKMSKAMSKLNFGIEIRAKIKVS